MLRSHRRRRRRNFILVTGLVLLPIVAGGWWYFRPFSKAKAPVPSTPAPALATLPPQPKSAPPPVVQKPAVKEEVPRAADVKLVADEEVVLPAHPTTQPAEVVLAAHTEDDPPAPAAADPEPQPQSQPAPRDPVATCASSDARTDNRGIADARKLLDAGQVIEARHQLNALLKGSLSETENSEVRALLTRIADDTVFGRRSVPNDPLVDSYSVQAGDVLVNISKNYNVPYEVLMEINGITDPAKIRQDQKLKVLRGPFNAKIYKSKFRMDVYLGELYVRSYRVGLGNENGTPEGVWKVKNRLENPTYYPPASATDKRIIAPDDPNNPLGKRWIGLEGIEGDAVGHDGYGIHGTIDPDSIGKAASLGCIRMHNEDVAFVYKLMTPGRSTVTILP